MRGGGERGGEEGEEGQRGGGGGGGGGGREMEHWESIKEEEEG